MINSKTFYKQFQINYFDYKTSYLNDLLDNHKTLCLDKKILHYNDDDFIRAIKIDLRQTVFQAIETVFEIFFGLIPNNNGKPTDRLIQKITLSPLPYDEIRKISSEENSLDFLNRLMFYPNSSNSTLGEFIFYVGLHERKDIRERIKNSISAIKFGLTELAKEFSNRHEYNSYKHGLRIIPFLSTFSVHNSKNKEIQLSFDLKDSMTFYSFDKKSNQPKYVTKTFDSKRDTGIISFCSILLWNMIKLRDFTFNTKDFIGKSFDLFFPEKKDIEKMIKNNVQIQNMSLNIDY